MGQKAMLCELAASSVQFKFGWAIKDTDSMANNFVFK